MSPILMLTADSSAEFTSTVVIAGIVIVLAVLVLLILVFYMFGMLVSRTEAAAKKRKKGNDDEITFTPVVPAPQVRKPAPVPAVEPGISGDVVAAITAAIVACEGTGVTIRSIRRRDVGSRNPWAQAAVVNNTQPF